MIYLKASYHSILFKHESSYDSTFAMHHGKYHWLRMQMGLTQVPANFQFVVELTIKGKKGDSTLPVVMYFDDIAVFGDG